MKLLRKLCRATRARRPVSGYKYPYHICLRLHMFAYHALRATRPEVREVDETTLEDLMKGESAGWIMRARVEVPGAGSP
jgi:hypothetical protein